MGIHSEHPFMPDPDERDLVRRFRGRLAAPVTIVTAGGTDRRAGLTVSSLLAVEGDPGEVLLVVNPDSDLWEATVETGRFVVHICTTAHRSLAEVFAGRYPAPGGAFAGVAVSDSPHGPVLEDIGDRMYAGLISIEEAGWSGLVRAGVERVEVGSTTDPLLYFRGRYRGLA